MGNQCPSSHTGGQLLICGVLVEVTDLAIQKPGTSLALFPAFHIVTDPTLSKSLPINNIKMSRRSMSFDWKDPDGDNDHWRLELSGKNDGQIVWVGLPSDVRV